MNKKEKYFDYIVNKMIKDTRYTFFTWMGSGEVMVDIGFPMYEQGYTIKYELDDVENWINRDIWYMGTEDKVYLTTKFGASKNEHQEIMNRYNTELAKIILNE